MFNDLRLGHLIALLLILLAPIPFVPEGWPRFTLAGLAAVAGILLVYVAIRKAGRPNLNKRK